MTTFQVGRIYFGIGLDMNCFEIVVPVEILDLTAEGLAVESEGIKILVPFNSQYFETRHEAQAYIDRD